MPQFFQLNIVILFHIIIMKDFFNIIMLILGILIYTWMISSISNYFMDNDVDLIKYKKI